VTLTESRTSPVRNGLAIPASSARLRHVDYFQVARDPSRIRDEALDSRLFTFPDLCLGAMLYFRPTSSPAA
jgi:hypothetical protein